MSKIQAFKDVLAVMKANEKHIKGTFVDIIHQIEVFLPMLQELERFELPYNENMSPFQDYIEMGQYGHFSKHGAAIGRTIAWPDDDRQPEEGEWLFVITFSSGAYIFGQHYPKELFNQLFADLKEFKPKYLDSQNHYLYYSHDTAKAVYTALPDLLRLYHSRAKSERNDRILQLEAELKKLKNA